MTTPTKDKMLARVIDRGMNPTDAQELLTEIYDIWAEESIPKALLHWHFITMRQYEKMRGI